MQSISQHIRSACAEPGNRTAREAMMVAAHGWDIAGAQAAGLQTAFVARPGKVLYPLAEKPDHIVNDFEELADLLLKPSK
jgi:2-haloacid dehalogenase